MPRRREGERLTCFCESKPLLAICGVDSNGEPYVHIKAYRSVGRGRPARLFAEMVAHAGLVRIRCRKCGRWHSVTIKRVGVDFHPEKLPRTLPLEQEPVAS